MAEDIFERTRVFHIPSHHAEFFDIPPLDQKKREERSSILDVKQRSFLKICCQLDGNLHMITFDYTTVLDL